MRPNLSMPEESAGSADLGSSKPPAVGCALECTLDFADIPGQSIQAAAEQFKLRIPSNDVPVGCRVHKSPGRLVVWGECGVQAMLHAGNSL